MTKTLRDEWETPQELFDTLNNQYNFDVDCCANELNKKCERWSNNFEGVKVTSNRSTYWMNPPYSTSWRMFEHFFKIVKKGVAIYRCDNLETAVWHKLIFPNVDWIFIPNKRIRYMCCDNPYFPSALIGVGVEPPKNIKGIILKVIN